MEVRLRIQQAGLKVTPQRQLVYKVAQELCHAPIEQFISKIEHSNPEITVSTIYRILNSFCEAELLSKIQHPDGKTYYDINVHEHCHLVREEKTLVDIDDPELMQLIHQRLGSHLAKGEKIEKICLQITTSYAENK